MSVIRNVSANGPLKGQLSALAGAAVFALSTTASGQQPNMPSLAAQPARAMPTSPGLVDQPQANAASIPTPDETGDEDEIVIKRQRPRGSVIGDIPPENTLDTRDLRTTGAANLTELLTAIAPQVGSVRGRGGDKPVLLLNGQRISSFREVRDIPTEAILRVDILPEEVALKYGYRADQKVVNAVLRRRFRSTKTSLGGGGATDGGYASGEGDLTRFLVQRRSRTTLNLHAVVNSMLTESERDIILDATTLAGATQQQLAARSLIGSKTDWRASGSFNHQLAKNVTGTLNAQFEHVEDRTLTVLNPTLLVPLVRKLYTDTAHAGLSLNGQTRSQWRWTITSNMDVAAIRTKIRSNDPALPGDRIHETAQTGDLAASANGNLFSLPGGDASTTLTCGGGVQHLTSSRMRLAAHSLSTVSRSAASAGLNLDLPISRRNHDFSALGNLTLNANAEVNRLSDFGALTTIGAGLNWSLIERMNFIASWTREKGAPTLNQLGDPVLDTPGSRIFDFRTGQTVFVHAITGGNPGLKPDRRSVVKLGGNWQPFNGIDLRLRADYVHQVIADPISNVTATSQVEAAFPSRFVRDSFGRLVSVDLTPINFDRSRRDQLRLGFDFSKPLKSHSSSRSVMDQLHKEFGSAARGSKRAEGGSGEPAFGGSIGSAGGGPNRGRLQVSLTDTITLVDRVILTPGGDELDYLGGAAVGSLGGTPQHDVQAQLGYFNNGIGVRIGGNWRSATDIASRSGENLHFSPVGTLNLRLFANAGDVPEILVMHPWLRGTQVRIDINNIFNVRPKVHDADGAVPLNFQPSLLDPLGRTIMISFRKLFQPAPTSASRPLQKDHPPSQDQSSRRLVH